MNTGLRITAYTAALAATFGSAYGVGQGVGPVADKPTARQEAREAHGAGHAGEGEAGKGADRHGDGHDGAAPGAAQPAAGGLQISDGGYTLDLDTPRIAAGKPAELRFSVEDGSGRKVTAYQREHGKELHFIVASRDLTVYRHLHPVRAVDGTWSTPVRLPAAGGYRVFADFKPAGDAKGLTLGADLAVSGAYAPAALPARSARAGIDGYEVTLDGRLTPGRAGELKLRIAKSGKPVTDLEPYLGSYGHLVALRSGDLAYLHVHPNEGGPGPEVSFTATAPSAGSYRLFLDFQHEGKVRTAAFTVHVGAGEAAGPGSAEGASADGHAH
ncbi:hypothetical protein GCM10020367_28940 [Streptomyces sannanensis]|uniref:DUF748 domain-containing protein n=1 Tax=Streptomyces sannanensis TaxID=285536 RepID=A0ABP6SBM5_9ACTN